MYCLDYTIIVTGLPYEAIPKIGGSLQVSAVVQGKKMPNVGGITGKNLIGMSYFFVQLPTNLTLVESIGLTYKLPADGQKTGTLLVPDVLVVSSHPKPALTMFARNYPEQSYELLPDKELTYPPCPLTFS